MLNVYSNDNCQAIYYLIPLYQLKKINSCQIFELLLNSRVVYNTNTNTGQDLKLNYLSVKSNISLILCEWWKWLKLPVISQLYSYHRQLCHGFCLHLQLSFRWLRNILDFSDGFTQQCSAGARADLSLKYFTIFLRRRRRWWDDRDRGTPQPWRLYCHPDREYWNFLHFALPSGPQLYYSSFSPDILCIPVPRRKLGNAW